MAKFGGVGLCNTVTDFAVFAGLVLAGLHPVAANAVSFCAANGQSYLVNAAVTFRNERGRAPLSFAGYGRFFAAHLVSLAVSSLIIAVFAKPAGPFAAKAAAIAFTFCWNYFAASAFVFRGAAPERSES